VFRVTQRPQIHTNGFHFAFDLGQHGSLGYVLPTWLGDQPLEPELLQAVHSSMLVKLTQQGGSSTLTSTAAADASNGGRWVGPAGSAAHLNELHSVLAGLAQQHQPEGANVTEDKNEQLDEEEVQHQQQRLLWLQAHQAHDDGVTGLRAAAAADRQCMMGPASTLTVIHLPLRPECDEVHQKLDHLRPTLLLFLRKLRCLMLTDAEAEQV
jgi:hypothetical protein